MYKSTTQLSIEDFVFPYGKLKADNRWVKMADLVPWNTVEADYAAGFVNNGAPAHPARMAFGTLIAKQILGVSDEELVCQVAENAYLQYFIGLKLGILPIGFWTSWTCSVLPSAALCFMPMSQAARFIRGEMLDVLEQDYIITAKSKGMGQVRLLMSHALRNSIIPVVTIMGPMMVNLLTGSLAIESIFSVPGLGSLFVDSIRNNDYNVIMALAIFYSAFYIIVVLLVDVAYCLIDPRIRLQADHTGGE